MKTRVGNHFLLSSPYFPTPWKTVSPNKTGSGVQFQVTLLCETVPVLLKISGLASGPHLP